MEFPIKVIVILVLALVVALIILMLITGFSGKSNETVGGMFDFFKNILGLGTG